MKFRDRLLIPAFLFAAGALTTQASQASLGPPKSDFPANYEASVKRFRFECEQIKLIYPRAVCGHETVPARIDTDLAIDFLYVPPANPESLLVITSGVHGAEGFAGSAVQHMFVRDLLPRMDHQKLGVLLIHAVNPFGFKHFRRVNENNVDLNRNFPATPALYALTNPGYEALASRLEPLGQVNSPLVQRVFQDVGLLSGLVFGQYSVKELGDSIGQGQHTHPVGLEYGGVQSEPQVGIVQNIVSQFTVNYRRVVFVDVHTGLGAENQLHMMTGDGVNYSGSPLLQKLLRPTVDGNNYDLATGDDAGFYPTPGDIINFLPFITNRNGQESIALTAEFGTIGTGTFAQLQTLNRLILENQGFHNGYASASVQAQVEADFHELFDPNDQAWRDLVVTKARYVLSRISERLAALSTP